MCFSIPVKVIKKQKNTLLLETGKTIKLETTLNVKQGEYVRVSGDMIVDTLTKEEGDSIRTLITELNTNYDG